MVFKVRRNSGRERVFQRDQELGARRGPFLSTGCFQVGTGFVGAKRKVLNLELRLIVVLQV